MAVSEQLTNGEASISSTEELISALSTWRDTERSLTKHTQELLCVNPTDFQAVRYLFSTADSPTPVTAGILAEYLTISSASTTKVLDRLESAGHVTRRNHPTDRRALTVSLTPATVERLTDIFHEQSERRMAIIAALSPEEQTMITHFLTAMSRATADGLTSYKSHHAPRRPTHTADSQ